MPNAKMISVRDFSGGRNDLLPPDQIANNEAVDMVNMIPGDEGQPLAVRPGFSRFNQNPIADSPIRGLFRYRRNSGSKAWVTTCGTKAYTTSRSSAVKKLRTDDKAFTFSTRAFTATPASNGPDFIVGKDVVYENLNEQGHESNACVRTPLVGTSASLRYNLRSPEATHQTVFRYVRPDAGDIAQIKVGLLKNGVALKNPGEFWIELRGDGMARMSYRDNQKVRSGPWAALSTNIDHTLEWTVSGKFLTIRIDGVVYLNQANFGSSIKTHDSVLWAYKGPKSSSDMNVGASLRVYSITDIERHFSTEGSGTLAYRTTKTAGATVTIAHKSTLTAERVEVVARTAQNVSIKVNGSPYLDDDGNPVVMNEKVGASRPMTIVELGAAGDHTVTLEVAAGGELSLDGVNILQPADPFNELVSKTKPWTDTDFVVNTDKLIFTDGEQPGVFIWNGLDATAKHQTLSKEGDPEQSAVPTVKYLLSFRNRVFAAGNPTYPSRVYFTAGGDATNWNGTSPADGGNLDIDADNGEVVTGLGRIFNGVVVFKERSIYLWTWGDADKPSTEGRVEQLVPGVGLVSHYSIAYYNGQLIFLGQNSEGDFGIYRLQGQGVEEYSVKIPKALRRILAGSPLPPRAVAYNHHYMVAVDDNTDENESRRLVFVLDLRRMCWTFLEGIPVGAWAIDRDKGDLYFGSDSTGFIYQYGAARSDDGKPIPYRYVSKPFDGGSPLADHRFRNIWLDLNGSSAGEITVGYSLDGSTPIRTIETLKIPGLQYWDDGWTWDDGSVWYDGEVERHISVPIPTNRAKHLSVVIEGETYDELAVARYGIAFRDRKTRY